MTREDKVNETNHFFFSKWPFWAYIKKLAHSLFDVGSFFLVHVGFTPSEGPKGFAN